MSKSERLQNAIAIYMEGIRDGNYREAVEKYTGGRYTQHSSGVEDGVEGFCEFFGDFIERSTKREIEVVRCWEDERFAFVQAYQKINDGESEWVTTDFFDFDEDSKIIEHWDCIAPFSPTNPSERSAIDGPTEIRDIEKTEENKQIVKDMLKDLFFRDCDISNIDKYFGDVYIQHNKNVGDGVDTLKEKLSAEDRGLFYEDIVMCVGQGNFVATLCQVFYNETELAQVDIFRLEDGKIIEHWDNAEPVTDRTTKTGKFYSEYYPDPKAS